MSVIFLGARLPDIPELEKEVKVLDLPLPEEAETADILDRETERLRANPSARVELDLAARANLIQGLLGLTVTEMENVLAKAAVRDLVHVNVTTNPAAAWVWRQLIEATPWGTRPRHLLRDRDAVYGRDFRRRAKGIGIDAIATRVRAPRANAIAERVIGTLRRECLDHPIVLDEQHVRSVLSEYVGYYNRDQPHRTRGLQTPERRPRPTSGRIRSRPARQRLAERRRPVFTGRVPAGRGSV